MIINYLFRRIIVASVCGATFFIATGLNAAEFRGQMIQGGLVIGQTQADAKVEFNGRVLRVSADGHFVFGFPRKAAPMAELKITYADGKMKLHKLAVEAREYDIQKINGLPKNKVEPTAEEWARIAAEQKLINKARAREDDRVDFLQEFIWPVTGRISGVYGSRRILNGKPKNPHAGVDVAAPEGTVIVAPISGVVSLVHDDMFYTGGTLFIQHGHAVSTMYIHLSEILVEQGQEVVAGQPIAKVGMTGRATGPHLHWAMNWFNTRLDPALMVPPMAEVLKQQANQ